MKILRNHINLICSILWGINFLMDIPLVIKNPSVFHVALMILHFIIACLFFGAAVKKEFKK